MKLDPPFFGNDGLVLFSGLIVQNLEVSRETTRLEPLHDCVIGFKVMATFTCLEGTCEYCTGITALSDHDILVTTAAEYREPLCVVSLELARVEHMNMQLV